MTDNSIDYGVGNDLINEASASLELAEMLKEKLEAKGLRVELTRDAESTPSYYGRAAEQVLVMRNRLKYLFL